MGIAENLDAVLCDIRAAEREAGRDEGEVMLLPVSKMMEIEALEEAYSAGVRVFGENYVQELCAKAEHFGSRAEFHFIGHLQRNKVKYIVDKVSMIHSVDGVALADEIERQCAKKDLKLRVLIEVNIGGEQAKSGVAKEGVLALAEHISKLPHLNLSGLMTIPPQGDATPYFLEMEKLFVDIRAKKLDNTNICFLSMGMSGDYRSAIRCGANIVRVGTAIFGSRKKK